MARVNVCHQEQEFWQCWQRLSSERYFMLDLIAILVFLIKVTTILKHLTYNLDFFLKFECTGRWELKKDKVHPCTGSEALYRPYGTWGSRGIALLFLDYGTRRGWVVSVTPRLLFTPGKDPVPIVQEAGWAPVQVWTGAEISPPHRDSITGPSSPLPVAIPTTLPGPPLRAWCSVKPALMLYRSLDVVPGFSVSSYNTPSY